MGQLEKKHDRDGNGKVSDSHRIGSSMPSPVTAKPTLCVSPCAKQHSIRTFFINRVSKASNSLFSLLTAMLGEMVWEL